jgi:hypothetical protein
MSGKTKKLLCQTAMSGNGPITLIPQKGMGLTSGIRSEIGPLVIRGIVPLDIWRADMKIMNMNFHDRDDGGMNPPIPHTSGFPIISEPIGDLTGMADGYGILSTVTCGHPMIPGDGLPITTDAGIGATITAGTGSPVTAGHRPGFPGSGMTIITDGAL